MEERMTIEERLASYQLFASLLLSIPDEKLVASLLEIDFAQGGDVESEGIALLSQYIDQARRKTAEDVLQEVSVDRTWLLRGTTKNGPRPPYESLFRGSDARTSISALYQALAAEGYIVAKDVHETPDYLGIEMSYMQELCARQLDAERRGDLGEVRSLHDIQAKFWGEHLGTWIHEAADEMEKWARTDFFRAVAAMLHDFADSEESILAD